MVFKLFKLGWRATVRKRDDERRGVVPADGRHAGLQLHLARLHGDHRGAELLQVPSGQRDAAVLGGQQEVFAEVPGRGSQGSQGLRQG